MKIAVSSTLGSPRDPRTWSSAPANLIDALERRGAEIVPIDSSSLSGLSKCAMAANNLVRGYPGNAVSWFAPARRKRARLVARGAAGCDIVLCTGSLDAPYGQGVDYAIWLDNTFGLLRESAAAPPYSASANDEIERLERLTLQGARAVLPFSKHVRDDVVRRYGVPPERVRAVGCGSGPMPPLKGEKRFAEGHLLFVAKHLFTEKGGALVLDAFPLIRAARPNTRLVLIGDEKAKARAAGIDGVECYGFLPRERLVRYFHGAAILVQPMRADPWGQVYLEAMKARAVVVGLDVAAMREITDCGRLGVLVRDPAPQAIAEAVLSAYARPQVDLDTLTREAQARVLQNYGWDTVADNILSTIEAGLSA